MESVCKAKGKAWKVIGQTIFLLHSSGPFGFVTAWLTSSRLPIQWNSWQSQSTVKQSIIVYQGKPSVPFLKFFYGENTVQLWFNYFYCSINANFFSTTVYSSAVVSSFWSSPMVFQSPLALLPPASLSMKESCLIRESNVSLRVKNVFFLIGAWQDWVEIWAIQTACKVNFFAALTTICCTISATY